MMNKINQNKNKHKNNKFLQVSLHNHMKWNYRNLNRNKKNQMMKLHKKKK